MVCFAKLLLSEPDASTNSDAVDDDRASSTPYECVLSELIPLLTSLLGCGSVGFGSALPTCQNSSTALSEAASEALLEVAALIQPQHVGETVLREVLCLAHDNEVEENRVVATLVLGSLAPVLGA